MKKLLLSLLLLISFVLDAEAALTLTLARHGETTWNAQKRIQGQLSYFTEADGSVVAVTLSEKGIQQAEVLAKKLQDVQFTHCFSSDLLRALDTAAIVTQNRNLPVIQDARLRVRSRGPWEGKFESEFLKAPLSQKLQVETDEQMCARLFSFLQELAATIPSGNVLVIGHERVITNIVVQLMNLPLKPNDIPVDHTGMVQLVYTGDTWEITNMLGIQVPTI